MSLGTTHKTISWGSFPESMHLNDTLLLFFPSRDSDSTSEGVSGIGICTQNPQMACGPHWEEASFGACLLPCPSFSSPLQTLNILKTNG